MASDRPSCRDVVARRDEQGWNSAFALIRGTVTLVLAGTGTLRATVQQRAFAPGDTVTAAAALPLVFDGATVVDVEHGKLIPDQRVVITGNRIQAVGGAAAIRMPKRAQVVDARGKYLIPGLWDMHVHLDRSADVAFPLLLANGVTGFREPGSWVPLDTLRLWRQEVLTGRRVGPQDCSKTRVREGDPQACVTDTADARHLVDSLKAAGADMIKPRALQVVTAFAIAAEARRIGIPFGGHAEGMSALTASDSGFRIIDHMQYDQKPDGIAARCWGGQPTADIEGCGAVAERFRRNGTWWVPTLVVSNGWHDVVGGGVRARVVGDRYREGVRAFLADAGRRGPWHPSPDASSAGTDRDSTAGSLAIAQSVELPILAGTDVSSFTLPGLVFGFSLHEELAMEVAEGLTPLQALQAATLNPAKMWHAADLVLLDADPLVHITNTTTIRAVVADGHYYDRAALDALQCG